MPKDPFQREIDYLRISVIDRCNLRCVYCMPLRGLSFVPGPELLTCAEIVTVVKAAAGLGFRKVRLTGGEPTLRADLLDIVSGIAGVEGIGDVGMTTNALLLPEMASALVGAGLKRINIHIDSLHPERLKRVMRFGHLDAMLAGLHAAEAAGLRPIKINCVVVRDYNDPDVVEMARLTIEREWHVRFIELMPLGGGTCAQLSLSQFVPSAESRRRIEASLGPLTPLPGGHPSDESRNYRLDGARGVVGFISPVSEPYCGACNRMRLTADGKFHLCLLHDDELDVKKALRNGGGVDDVRRILLEAVSMKPTGHDLDKGVSTEVRSMFQIGG
ncbi:MAG: GTP 3',8-cyclase MoaA [Phycisphaerae bacterium]|nr:MAG: GTP 3',8-cyclase MoaA [Planctomycetota bacterium]KAB2945711.1 MAG: GTP 3',8-cyclase MoaA [Phycisphaerae bacterium]MBE7457205.1 GTP 3',8-cyclase MoaA [Planctomycetia bacterium]MCK6466069.1 GTP 3',8-cyclase MoaA [Phycisphaerae bacterium]MCL4719800.1 GTP 3',8-cyclase MoaA [Phycisphaerae bacterium]